MAAKKTPTPPIAVVGVSALFPGSQNASGFWRDILAGRDLITDVPPSHWLAEDYYDPDPKAPDKTYCKRGAFLDPVDFDCMAHGTPPNLLEATDTCQLLALIVAQQVLDDASSTGFEHIDRKRMSVILGATGATELVVHLGSRLQRPIWLKALRDSGVPEPEAQGICEKIANSYVPWQEASFPGLLGNVIAGRIANRLDLGGTNCVVDAACASSLSAMKMGLQELYLGDSDMVITGGVDTLNDILMYMCFSKTPALSPSQDCRPFSDKADGTILGEGMGMVALRRLADAERDGDRIYAVLHGQGSSSDGRAKSVYAPRAGGQAMALRRTYDTAGYEPSTVELVEAHGTGTKAGDVAEFEGLCQVFGKSDGTPRCALGSIKSQIGHTKGAAGAASLFKMVMALHHKVLPPTIKVDLPNPKLNFADSPFYLNTRTRPWIRGSDHPRRASLSSFGFGGSNFHMALEEYTGTAPRAWRLRESPSELILVSAPSSEALFAAADELLEGRSDADALTFLARFSQQAFDPSQPARLALVAETMEHLGKLIEQARDVVTATPDQPQQSPKGWWYSCGQVEGDTAFLFPGQGSQYIDMGADLARAFDEARAVWDRAADLPLDAAAGLHDVVFPIPVFNDEERAAQVQMLTRTDWAQPAIGAVSLSQLALLEQLGVQPQHVGGHSFGEVTALCAAGVFDESNALRIARRRGELMAEAATHPGAMTAVRHDVADLQKLLADWAVPVVLANHNSPSQAVLSGTVEGIDAAEAKLREAKIRFQRLPVATAFHSSVVSSAAKPFKEFLGELKLKAPQLPVYANSTASTYATKPQSIRKVLAEQITKPVRFSEQIEAMYAAGARTFVEVGPNAILTRLVGDILGDRPHAAIKLDAKGRHGLTSLWQALAQLAVRGHAMHFDWLWETLRPAEDPRDRKAPRLAKPVSGVNCDKPYPPAGGAAALPAPVPARKQAATVREAAPPTPQASVPAAHDHGSSKPLPEAETSMAPITATPGPGQSQKIAATTERGDPAMPTQPAADSGAPLSPNEGQAWVAAFQDLQSKTTEAHMAYLRVAERSFASIEAIFTGNTSAVPAASGSASPSSTAVDTPVIQQPVAQAPEPRKSPPPPAKAPVTPSLETAEAVVAAPSRASTPATPAAAPAPPAKAAPASPGVDLTALLLDVVATKTGYPVDMLELEMDMESDLGIDSIKRVEILSAMQEQAPGLPEVDPAELGSLHTLGQIVERYADAVPATSQTTAAEPVSDAPAASQPAEAGSNVADLTATLLTVVAAKTGYPEDMLELEMDMESDLGIDSIKRVEILSAMQEQAPGLPEVDPAELGSLRTLGQIVERYTAEAPSAAAPMVKTSIIDATPGGNGTSRASATSQPAEAGTSVADLTATLLTVVAAKTGYPEDMLELEMDMESDLGIDSIKRVEILSAMQEQAPGLPEVDPAELGSLRTLGQIVERYTAATPAATEPAATEPAATEPAAATPAAAMPTIEFPKPAPAATSVKEIHRYAVELQHSARPNLAPEALIAAPEVQITEDAAGVAHALANALKKRGLNSRVVKTPDPDAQAVVSLSGLVEVSDEDAALDINREVFRLVTTLAPDFEKRGGYLAIIQDTGGDYAHSGDCGTQAWLGGLAGLARTAAREWPLATVRSIDMDRGRRGPSEQAHRLADELTHGGGALEVGLPASGGRHTLRATKRRAEFTGAWESHNAVLVVSGGARGVTAASILELASSSKACRFGLLGRTPLEAEPECCAGAADDAAIKQALLKHSRDQGQTLTPLQLQAAAGRVLAGREIRSTMTALDSLGAKSIYLSCDVTDAADTARACGEIRDALGPITGIVHGAGVLADKRLTDKTEEQFRRVFDTKVEGLRSLLAATANDALTMMTLFSSVAARAGNPGQADYAMANEVLNRVAHVEARRRGKTCVVRTINWGPWSDGMVTPQLAAHFRKAGVALIPTKLGAEAFVAELGTGRAGAVETVIGGGDPALALSGDAAKEIRYLVEIDAKTHPQLASHSIDGVPVLPLVLVQEWFQRAAGVFSYAGLTQVDLQVIQGIPLEGFDDHPQRFMIACHYTRDAVSLALHDHEGKVRYQAHLEPNSETTTEPPEPRSFVDGGPCTSGLYDGPLFHGPEFVSILDLHGLDQGGAAGTLQGTDALQWPEEPWCTDPLMLDGGLQLLRVWGFELLGRPTLPTSVGRFVLHQKGLAKSRVECRIEAEKIGRLGLRANLWFLDCEGHVIAEMTRVEMHVAQASHTPTPALEQTS